VLVETKGLADPGPVAQTFFIDDEIRNEFSLDGIVTLVDAAHIDQKLERSDESPEQVAFAGELVSQIAWRSDNRALAAVNAKGGITVWEFKVRTKSSTPKDLHTVIESIFQIGT